MIDDLIVFCGHITGMFNVFDVFNEIIHNFYFFCEDFLMQYVYAKKFLMDY